jgi:hypothetical protein
VSRLPSSLQPWWPAFKRLHRLLTLMVGVLARAAGPLLGRRRLPTRGYSTPETAAAAEPAAVTYHRGPAVSAIRRAIPRGEPAAHWAFATVAVREDVPDLGVLEVRDGTVVGDLGAVITPGGGLDVQSSHYWGIAGWREHPIFLKGRLPRVESVPGSLAVLATRGGGTSYYHFLLDVLPRMEVLRRVLPEERPDHWYLPRSTRYHSEILSLAGLDALPVVESAPDRAVRAQRLLVPGLPNHDELSPTWVTRWLRELLPAGDTAGLPRRLYVTRGVVPNTRRLVQEPIVWPELERRGFVRIDPGAMSVREQVDHFAAADVIVGVHGAALTNLVFCKPGVRVLHLMAPTYVKHCFHAILAGIPDTDYTYLLGDGEPATDPRRMNGIQHDISISPQRLLAALDELL